MYSPLRYAGHILWKRRPIHLTFFVTRRCNAKCPFCFYLQEQRPHTGDAPELSLKEIGDLAPSMGNLLWLAFSGGEVYLRDDIVDISKVFYKHNRPAVILFSTNGLAPGMIRDKTEEILKSCNESTVVVKLSLDDIGAGHDALRGVSGSFEKVMRSYDLLAELTDKYPNFELGINTVFCAANQDRIDNVFDFVRGLDRVRTHTLSMIRGHINDKSLKEVDLNKYRKAIEAIESDVRDIRKSRYRFFGARFKSAQDILQRRIIHRIMLEQQHMIPCYAGRLNLVLTETGDVYPCETFSKLVGNIRDYGYDMRELTHSPRAMTVQKQIHDSRCYCSHECYVMTNILFNARMYPSLLKEYMQIK